MSRAVTRQHQFSRTIKASKNVLALIIYFQTSLTLTHFKIHNFIREKITKKAGMKFGSGRIYTSTKQCKSKVRISLK